MGVIRRLPLDVTAAVLVPAVVVLFAFGSSSVDELVRIGSKGRWIALLLLAAVALARATPPRSIPMAWVAAAVFVLLGSESALWSVEPRITVGRIFTVAVLFVTACALALGAPTARAAATDVFLGVLRGIALVAAISVLVLVVAHGDAVLPATTGAGWRFRGVGLNPNTVSMLLCVGLPLAVWRASDRAPRARVEGLALSLLFAAEIGFSASRGALIAGAAGAAATALVLVRSTPRKLAVAGGILVLAVACAQLGKLPQPIPVSAAPTSTAKVVRTRGVDAERVFRLEDEFGFPLGGAYRSPVRRTILGSSGRAQAWDGALRQAARRPVDGYGFGTENHVFVDRWYAFQSGFVENTYVGLLLQLGVAGLLSFVVLLGALAWSAVRAVRRDVDPAAAALGVLVAAGLIGVTQTGLLSVGNIAATSIWVCVLTLPLLAAEARDGR